jgi:hypothetical protein
MGADPDHKDLFVEIDAMAGLAPAQAALNDVVTAFAAAPVSNPDGVSGIDLHIIGGGCPVLGPCVDQVSASAWSWPSDTDLTVPGGSPGFDAFKAGVPGAYGFGTSAEQLDPNWVNIEAAKEACFRYCVFGHSFGGTSSSGFAEISINGTSPVGGNDFAVTFGNWANVAPDEQAGTFMHELGHTLGLLHGGNQVFVGMDHRYNCKPNYFSVMNGTCQRG